MPHLVPSGAAPLSEASANSLKDSSMPGFRLVLVVGVAGLFVAPNLAAAPVAVQEAMTQARNLLAQNQPAAAAQLLEAQLHLADGDREFKELLRTVYAAELRTLTNQKADPKALAAVRTKLNLVGGPPAEAAPSVPELPGLIPLPTVSPVPATAPIPAPVPPPAKAPESTGLDLLKQATAVFNEAKNVDPKKFFDASKLFGLAFANKVQMRKDQLAAWAYCRVKLAADRLNKSSDATTASEVVAEVEDALTLAPDQAALQTVGQEVLAVARKRAGTLMVPKGTSRPAIAEETSAWQTVETDNFLVKHLGSRELAEQVGRTAESKRNTIAALWSGPLGSTWKPKCEILLHADGACLNRMTNLPTAATGRAEVKLKDGQVLSRRIDLRADDDTLSLDALPRELTHIILADLFWDQPPPKWAELGMCVLAASETERNRISRTVVRCARNRELLPIGEILKAREVPTPSVTGFYVESVSLVDYLVKTKGEKAFTSFVRDAHRYGTEAALKRQYGFADARAFEDAWRRATLP
jgi:hypothetical protein